MAVGIADGSATAPKILFCVIENVLKQTGIYLRFHSSGMSPICLPELNVRLHIRRVQAGWAAHSFTFIRENLRQRRAPTIGTDSAFLSLLNPAIDKTVGLSRRRISSDRSLGSVRLSALCQFKTRCRLLSTVLCLVEFRLDGTCKRQNLNWRHR